MNKTWHPCPEGVQTFAHNQIHRFCWHRIILRKLTCPWLWVWGSVRRNEKDGRNADIFPALALALTLVSLFPSRGPRLQSHSFSLLLFRPAAFSGTRRHQTLFCRSSVKSSVFPATIKTAWGSGLTTPGPPSLLSESWRLSRNRKAKLRDKRSNRREGKWKHHEGHFAVWTL